ncbi:AraC family transcriptional regulator [Acetobacteraceae bacterium H6797]|nr:AraC family transcriptional regulator [Acetobacteraceae bacterium H6797]
MDPLSEIIALLRPSAVLSKPVTGRGRWGIRYAATSTPAFAIIVTGGAWIGLEGREPLRLEQGDFLLVPTAPALSLCSDLEVACRPVEPGTSPRRYGEAEGEPDFAALGGVFAFEPANAALLVSLMPALIHIPAQGGATSRIRRLIGLLTEESAADHPGRELVLRRILEVLLVEALRWGGSGDDAVPPGLLNGMRVPGIARALAAIHAEPRERWTVARLAVLAGMSRSAFAARFGQMVGCAPIEYLARWRMALAKDALIRGSASLERIAEEIGYESASAFSTAFRKRQGVSPGAFARAYLEDRREAARPGRS